MNIKLIKSVNEKKANNLGGSWGELVPSDWNPSEQILGGPSGMGDNFDPGPSILNSNINAPRYIDIYFTTTSSETVDLSDVSTTYYISSK